MLLLRGAQTPGELRIRSERLCKFSDMHEVEAVLDRLMAREDGPFVVRLPREPGKRESRYAHLFCGDVGFPPELEESDVSGSASLAGRDRLGLMERDLKALRDEIEEIKSRLDLISPKF